MSDYNRCIFTGRLGADPELRTTATGVSVCSLRLAVERPKAKGAEHGETDWLDIIAWRQQAEYISRYFTKGRKVLVECSARTRTWEDKDGNKRKTVEFVATDIFPADSRPEKATTSNDPTATVNSLELGVIKVKPGEHVRTLYSNSIPTSPPTAASAGQTANGDDFMAIDIDGDILPF